MPFDFKKSSKDLYQPGTSPIIINIPEIYISDPRKTEAHKLKTVLRHPIRKVEIL